MRVDVDATGREGTGELARLLGDGNLGSLLRVIFVAEDGHSMKWPHHAGRMLVVQVMAVNR